METGQIMLAKQLMHYTLAELLQLQACSQSQGCTRSHSLHCHTGATKVPLGHGDSSASTALYTLTHEVVSTHHACSSTIRYQAGSAA